MNIAVCGLGKAGSVLAKKIYTTKEHNIVCGICREESNTAGKDIGEVLLMPFLNIPVIKVSQISNFIKKHSLDVVIDFSYKTTTLQLVKECSKNGINVVICTTNFEDEEYKEIEKDVKKSNIGVINAPNLTIGINLIIEFVERISKVVKDFDFTIVERHRKDKPICSTTAKVVAENINRSEVPIYSIRAGGYISIHEVTAANESERITIEHEAFSREAFADGAMIAANFIFEKKGYYQMKDAIRELEKKAFVED